MTAKHVPPTRKTAPERVAELHELLRAEEEHWLEKGVPISGMELQGFNQFSIHTKLVALFELVREISGKTTEETDVVVMEMQLKMLKELRPTMESFASEALRSRIMQGLPITRDTPIVEKSD